MRIGSKRMANEQLFLMANMGSEVLRALHFHGTGNESERDRSLSRAEDILCRVEQADLSPSAVQELSILKGALAQLRLGHPVFREARLWESYFNPFALRVMKNIQQGR